MNPEAFDLIVIGSGPAGEKGAAQAAYFGKTVAMIEKEPVLGGAAANTGTLPSKTLRETALYLSGFRNRDLHGLEFRMKRDVNVRDFMSRERWLREKEHTRIDANLRRHHVQLYRGSASFVDPHTIAVRAQDGTETRLRGEFILIATGSSPHRPELYSFEDPRIHDSDEILEIEDLPGTMLVVGGGVIGCEYACMFAEIGVHVTLVERRGGLVGSMDGEIARALQAQMEEAGIHVLTNEAVEAVDDSGERIAVRLKSGKEFEVDQILISSGRNGNTGTLALERADLAANERGLIPVNAHFQSAVPHIYAAGDVIGNPALASTAMEQARVAMVHAFELKYKEAVATILPYGIYTIPECSMAGETEESLRMQGIPYIAGRAFYAENARGQIVGDDRGFLKLLFHADDMRLLGVHMIGEQATEVVHVGLTALLMNAGADLFIRTCYNYPTLSEMYKYATYNALGQRNVSRGQAEGH